MTNKTIIDGIDVSECSNYDADQYFECEISSCHCDEIPTCYFKQLARAKEEIEDLKQDVYNKKLEFQGVLKELTDKEQECEELKKEKEEIKKYLGISDKTIMQRLEELAEFLNKTANDNCSICAFAKLGDCPVHDCDDGILQWLNQESKDCYEGTLKRLQSEEMVLKVKESEG